MRTIKQNILSFTSPLITKVMSNQNLLRQDLLKYEIRAKTKLKYSKFSKIQIKIEL